jgi:hypothetical protein
MRQPDIQGKLLKGDIPCRFSREVVPLVALGETPKIIELSQRNFTLDTLCFVHTALPVVRIVPESGTLAAPDALILDPQVFSG